MDSYPAGYVMNPFCFYEPCEDGVFGVWKIKSGKVRKYYVYK